MYLSIYQSIGKIMETKPVAQSSSVVPPHLSNEAPLQELDQHLADQQTSIMSKYAGSIEFSDEEFPAMLQELKEDK
jgi:arylsulfatase A-like enzyme